MKTLTHNQAGKLFRFDIEYFSLAPTPHDEKCTPAGENREANILECQALAGQLVRMHGKHEGAELFILDNYHEDAGNYLELAVMFKEPQTDAEGEEIEGTDGALEYANLLEGGIPDKWDAEALAFLEAQGHPYHVTKVVPMYRKTA